MNYKRKNYKNRRANRAMIICKWGGISKKDKIFYIDRRTKKYLYE